MSTPDIIETTPCGCQNCGCGTLTPLYRPSCLFCSWGWHKDDPRRYHGTIITAGMSNRALTKAHINQLIQKGIPCGHQNTTFP